MLLDQVVGQPVDRLPAWFQALEQAGVARVDATGPTVGFVNVSFDRDAVLFALSVCGRLSAGARLPVAGRGAGGRPGRARRRPAGERRHRLRGHRPRPARRACLRRRAHRRGAGGARGASPSSRRGWPSPRRPIRSSSSCGRWPSAHRRCFPSSSCRSGGSAPRRGGPSPACWPASGAPTAAILLGEAGVVDAAERPGRRRRSAGRRGGDHRRQHAHARSRAATSSTCCRRSACPAARRSMTASCGCSG